jgi:cytochrome b561
MDARPHLDRGSGGGATMTKAFVKNQKTEHFSTIAKFLHWMTAFLMLSIIPVALGFANIDRADRAEAIPVHASLGIIVLVLTVIRLFVRKLSPPPAFPGDPSSMPAKASKIGHRLIYMLLFAQMAIGFFLAAFSSVDIRFFNGWNISALAEARPAVMEQLIAFHFIGAWALTLLIAGHAFAALYHHFVRKDDVLIRMLPFSALVQRLKREGQLPEWRTPSAHLQNWPKRMPR